jgi:hypothetical protein
MILWVKTGIIFPLFSVCLPSYLAGGVAANGDRNQRLDGEANPQF